MTNTTSFRFRPMTRMLIALLAVLTALPFIGFTGGQAAAAPANGTIDATVQHAGDRAIVKIASGSMKVEDGYLVFRNNSGQVLDKYNLTFVAPNNDEYPVAAKVDGKTATLTPSKVAKKKAQPKRKPGQIICGPQTRAQRDREALQQLSTELGIGVAIGSVIGGVIGAILGSVVPGLGTGVGAVIGVVIGAVISFGGPAIFGTFTRYFETINSPFRLKYC